MMTFKNGSVKIGDTIYTPVSVDTKSRKLVIEAQKRNGIYYSDITFRTITRKVTKNGTFKLDGITFNAYDIEGVKFHLEGQE